jgi:D-alanyl-D-alanine carboxypeptidase/D-alanyl-D-alanine-endopeptidase (penicillin-binding protein 4)
MSRRVLPALLAVSLLAAPAHAAGANRVAGALAAHTAEHPQTGALVWRLDPGGPTTVASYKPDSARLPASTMKLATAAGALASLGPDFRFTTRLYAAADARLANGVLSGDLFLQGGGDPLLSTAEYARRYLNGRGANVVRLARPLKRRGITRVRGRIVADETVFDGRRIGRHWLSHYQLYSPPLSGLTTNQSYAGNRQGAYATRPALSSAVRLRSALRGVGIRTRSRVRQGRTPVRARLLSRATSPPLRVIVRLMNLGSDNHTAETLAKGVGAYSANRGTSAAGSAHIAKALRLRGILASSDRLADASGLSRANRLSAASLVRLMAHAETEPVWGRWLIASLPRGGEGTLVRRFRGSAGPRVRAKTGYINGVSTLAGRVVSRRGRVYAFALLMNHHNLTAARRTQDRIVALLAAGVADEL